MNEPVESQSPEAGAAGHSRPNQELVPAGGRLRPLPADAVPIVPVRNLVLFPGVVLPVAMSRPASLAAAGAGAQHNFGMLLQRDPAEDSPGPDGLCWVGSLAQTLRRVEAPDGTHHLLCRGESRFRVLEFLEGWPFLVARIERIAEVEQKSPEIEARGMKLREQALEVLELLPDAPDELREALLAMDSWSTLADTVAGLVEIRPMERQALLETLDLRHRLDKLLELVAHRLEVLRIANRISEQTRQAFGERQREAVLREQLRAIQKELGESEAADEEIDALAESLDQAGMPGPVAEHARKELKRLRRMSEQAGEHPMLRTYLEWLSELPWSRQSEDRLDIATARGILDDEHYGLDKIKRRILEYLAVRKLNPSGKSPILCFVGPPGVGKTSLGQSIAHCMGRAFARVALGGVHDEAEIRGHRRTYVGALPGNIVQALRKAGTSNPVIMLDEVDKLGGGGFHGDPAAALLEVLDPEQNASFRDNYLGVDVDLSRVMFICTANVLESIPAPLLDRMEVVQLPGYTQNEKLEIARRYLLERQREASGVPAGRCRLGGGVLEHIIDAYTREAGVRALEREIGAVYRSVAMRIAEGETGVVDIGPADLSAILGPRRFENEVAMRSALPGVATGLAWTPVGGDILFIEASRTPGSGRLILTGQLGEVMKESAQAALSLVKARLDVLGLEADVLERSDLHLHVPAGATPKDGPSAGVAMFLALYSLLAGRPVRSDIAMTGELSLRGLVLPVGGIKEKVLAALRAGIRTVMLPRRNERDLEEVPPEAREQLRFVLLDHVDDALKASLGEAPPEAVSA